MTVEETLARLLFETYPGDFVVTDGQGPDWQTLELPHAKYNAFHPLEGDTRKLSGERWHGKRASERSGRGLPLSTGYQTVHYLRAELNAKWKGAV